MFKFKHSPKKIEYFNEDKVKFWYLKLLSFLFFNLSFFYYSIMFVWYICNICLIMVASLLVGFAIQGCYYLLLQ
jgi:hypothetical protein